VSERNHLFPDDLKRSELRRLELSYEGPLLRKGALYVVATPIGNLGDITLRALATLRQVDTILAEDTRVTRKLCAHFKMHVPLRSFHQHTRADAVHALVESMLRGKTLALVSDAGTPVLSDPGAVLVSAALEKRIWVEWLPGASAVHGAAVLSNLCADGYRFIGFLPRSGKARSHTLQDIFESRLATIFFESPRRIQSTLQALATIISGERKVALCRELTKLHEEVVRGPLRTLLDNPVEWRGEITVVVEGQTTVQATPDAAELAQMIAAGIAEGSSTRAIAERLVQDFAVTKREAYQLVLQLRATSES